MKQKILMGAAIIVAIIALYANITNQLAYRRLENENQELQVRLAHASIPFKTDTIRDSITVVVQQVVEVESKAMKEALAADRQLISDLRLRIKELEALQQTAISISDSVPARWLEPDSLFRYSDEWATVELHLKDSTFYYNIRDSLATIVNRVPRHKFLWLRWGTKGYEVCLVNFNPHAHVTYNRYIKAGK